MAKSCRNCEEKCGKIKSVANTHDKLEDGFRKLYMSSSQSLLKKYLTKPIFESLKTKKTKYGSTLLDCIQSGLENLDSGIGIYAPDPDAYTIFADIFDPIIQDYHGFCKNNHHPPMDWGDPSTLCNLDPCGEFIVSTRVRCGRSLDGFPFNPCLTEAQYAQIEKVVSSCLIRMGDELQGVYYPLATLSPTDQQQLINDHFLFKEGDRFLQSANANRFWPNYRGIYHNNNKTFLVWINEEDHIRVISMQQGGDLQQIYTRLITAVGLIEQHMNFARNDRFGFLTFCPTNLGTTIRASVHIKLPKLSQDRNRFEQIAKQYNLQIRGSAGEHSEAQDGIYDISNKRRLGLTEYQAVKEMQDGILKLIEMEKSL